MHRLFKSTIFRIVLAVFISVGFIWTTFAITFALEGRAISDKLGQEKNTPQALASVNSKRSTPINSSSKTVTASKSFPDCQKVTNTEPDLPQADANRPGLNENTSHNYYSVYGYTPGDIYSQTQKCGPDTDEGVFEGSTNYRIRWSYSYNWQDQTNCKINSVAVGVNVKITLPKWEQPEGVAQSTIDYWNESITNLNNHENTHRQISIDGANKILQALRDLPLQNCSQIEQSAESRAMGIFDEIQASQKDFDDRTNHGANQG